MYTFMADIQNIQGFEWIVWVFRVFCKRQKLPLNQPTSHFYAYVILEVTPVRGIKDQPAHANFQAVAL